MRTVASSASYISHSVLLAYVVPTMTMREQLEALERDMREAWELSDENFLGRFADDLRAILDGCTGEPVADSLVDRGEHIIYDDTAALAEVMDQHDLVPIYTHGAHFAALAKENAELREFKRYADEANETLKTMCQVWTARAERAEAERAALAGEVEMLRNGFAAEELNLLTRLRKAEAERDKEALRLGWVLENCAVVRTNGEQWRVEFDWMPKGTEGPFAETKRNAIDAAMQAKGEGK